MPDARKGGRGNLARGYELAGKKSKIERGRQREEDEVKERGGESVEGLYRVNTHRHIHTRARGHTHKHDPQPLHSQGQASFGGEGRIASRSGWLLLSSL